VCQATNLETVEELREW